MIEHERSYVMTIEDGHRLLAYLGGSNDIQKVSDYYYDKNMRLREYDNKHCLTLKQGNKSSGYRFEQEEIISESASSILRTSAKMIVHKERHKVDLACDGTGKPPSYQITMDFVNQPMRLAILEIEATDTGLYPVPSDITSKLFNLNLQECPLSTWDLFNRKIGICGAPSSGKSETAKWISHTLNTKFRANSFHVAEFATTFIQKYKRNPEFYDQFFIWYGQKSREIDAQAANIVISDCPTFLSYIYMLILNTKTFAEDSAMYLSKVYKRALFDVTTYTDMIFLNLCQYSENNIRYQNILEAKKIEERILQFLDDHNILHLNMTFRDGEKMIRDLFHINHLQLPDKVAR